MNRTGLCWTTEGVDSLPLNCYIQWTVKQVVVAVQLCCLSHCAFNSLKVTFLYFSTLTQTLLALITQACIGPSYGRKDMIIVPTCYYKAWPLSVYLIDLTQFEFPHQSCSLSGEKLLTFTLAKNVSQPRPYPLCASSPKWQLLQHSAENVLDSYLLSVWASDPERNYLVKYKHTLIPLKI